jgi:predicted membrane channel-forming protein YqfA (hemolysin III family)
MTTKMDANTIRACKHVCQQSKIDYPMIIEALGSQYVPFAVIIFNDLATPIWITSVIFLKPLGSILKPDF